MSTVGWIVAGLLGSFLLAVVVGTAIRVGHRDTAQFQRDMRNPNRDNDRDDLGERR